MKISESSVERLSDIIIGGAYFPEAPYRTLSQLKFLFAQYESPEPEIGVSRKLYTEKCIRLLNNTHHLQAIIIDVLIPINFFDNSEYKQSTYSYDNCNRKPLCIESAVNYLNETLLYDGYKIQKSGIKYTVVKHTESDISSEITLGLDYLSHQVIKEQINKCNTKISDGDFGGAITNARTLVEQVLLDVEKELIVNAPNHQGKLPKLYNSVAKQLKLSPEKETNDDIKQTLSGLISVVQGIAALSNRLADRHAPKYKAEERHAKLVMNSAITLTNFIVDTFEYQQSKILENSKIKAQELV